MNVYVHLYPPGGASSAADEPPPRCKLGVLIQHALPRLAQRVGGYGQVALDWVTWVAEAGVNGAPVLGTVAPFGMPNPAHWLLLQELVRGVAAVRAGGERQVQAVAWPMRATCLHCEWASRQPWHSGQLFNHRSVPAVFTPGKQPPASHPAQNQQHRVQPRALANPSTCQRNAWSGTWPRCATALPSRCLNCPSAFAMPPPPHPPPPTPPSPPPPSPPTPFPPPHPTPPACAGQGEGDGGGHDGGRTDRSSRGRCAAPRQGAHSLLRRLNGCLPACSGLKSAKPRRYLRRRP